MKFFNKMILTDATTTERRICFQCEIELILLGIDRDCPDRFRPSGTVLLMMKELML